MNYVTVWVLNDRLGDGMPGTNRYYEEEGEARANFTEGPWQELTSLEAIEINGIVYFDPVEIMFS